MRRFTLWTLTIVTAGMFLLAGTLKLMGVEMEVQLFAVIGIGQWFRYLTGALEIAGAVGLFVQALAPYAALLRLGPGRSGGPLRRTVTGQGRALRRAARRTPRPSGPRRRRGERQPTHQPPPRPGDRRKKDDTTPPLVVGGRENKTKHQ